MDARFTDEQQLLRDSARGWLERECSMELVRSVLLDGEDVPASFGRGLADMGWSGLLVPPENGGAGLGAVELALLAEEMGRVLAPGPLVASSVVGVSALLAAAQPGADNSSAAYELAAAVADGSRTVALLGQGAAGSPDSLRCSPDGGGFVLDGVIEAVPGVGDVGNLLVPVSVEDAPALLLVDAGIEGLEITRHDYIDRGRRLCTVAFASVKGDAGSLLASGEKALAAVARASDLGRVALAAEACGLASRVLEITVDYAKMREQFGRPIGSFQAIQHKCADMLVAVECARSAALYAAWACDAGEPHAHVSACMAKAAASQAAVEVAEQGIQVHGGMGFTWASDLHLFFRRARALYHELGDPSWCREQVARAMLDVGAYSCASHG